jgi:hypothetical protein
LAPYGGWLVDVDDPTEVVDLVLRPRASVPVPDTVMAAPVWSYPVTVARPGRASRACWPGMDRQPSCASTSAGAPRPVAGQG